MAFCPFPGCPPRPAVQPVGSIHPGRRQERVQAGLGGKTSVDQVEHVPCPRPQLRTAHQDPSRTVRPVGILTRKRQDRATRARRDRCAERSTLD